MTIVWIAGHEYGLEKSQSRAFNAENDIIAGNIVLNSGADPLIRIYQSIDSRYILEVFFAKLDLLYGPYN